MSSRNYDDYLVCPITQELMQDPVTLPDCGHTFDKESIQTWLRSNRDCPFCRKPVSNFNLVTNVTIKHLIDKLKGEAGAGGKLKNRNSNGLNIESSITNKDGTSLLTIKVPDCVNRHPVSIVCVIDVSGSMGSIVGQGEGNRAFTRLDLVKHVLNVLVLSLEPNDQLCLITFSNKPKLILDLTKMTEQNKNLARGYISDINTIANTYTSTAIKLAYDVMKRAPESSIKSIILLTDGQDTDGEVFLQNQFDLIQKPNGVQFSTLGFSNDIWSASLQKLAIKGGGVFGFIPDQTMIGTIFINFLASTLLTCAQNVELKLDNYEIICPKQIDGYNKVSLYYGQTKNFLLKKKSYSTSGSTFNGKIVFPNKTEIELDPDLKNDSENYKIQMARMKLIEFLTDPSMPNINSKKYVDYLSKVTQFSCEFKQEGEYTPNNEQLALALQFYSTWGQHYMRSMYFAHQQEQCLNFKSPSMQIYSNEKFAQLVDQITDVFVSLPLPEPTGYYFDDSKSTRSAPVPKINTTYLMDRDSGCILGTCSIKMENGEYKPINKLKKGDIVYGGARIVCLIKMKYHGSLMKIGKLFITPFHPVLIQDKWQFPYDVVMNNNDTSNNLIIESGEGTYVFNIVLDKHHIVDVEGIGCITLGHMYDEGILKHDYFGTNKVIEDLSKLNGWNEGFISLQSYKIQRDSNGNVCGTTDHKYNCI